MTYRRLDPPGGDPAPETASIGSDECIDLLFLAGEIADRYYVEFPDELERYGGTGRAWCLHDNQYLLSWAAEAAQGLLDMNHEVAWLARVLEARDFPLERLARNLEIGSDVTREQASPASVAALADVLTDAAAFIRSRRHAVTRT